MDIPNLERSPNRTLIGFSQIAFPIIVLQKHDHTDFVQEEQLGLRYWTIPIWEFSIILEHLPFLHGYKQILSLLLVHRNLAIWR